VKRIFVLLILEVMMLPKREGTRSPEIQRIQKMKANQASKNCVTLLALFSPQPYACPPKRRLLSNEL